MDKFDLAVIGAGPGGYVAAIRAAQNGMKVAVIENRDIGGTCLNRGCIPTKALLHTANAYAQTKEFEAIGIKAENVTIDISKAFARKDDIVSRLRSGVEKLFSANKITVFRGFGKLISKDTVSIEGEWGKTEINAENIIIATGSSPVRPPIPGMELENVMTSDEIMEYSDKIPEELVIIGGGVIGVEFATVYSSIGTKVTIIEMMDRILPPMEREIALQLTALLKKRGIEISTSSCAKKIERNGDKLVLTYTDKTEKELSKTADAILVSTGRRANIVGLGLEEIGVTVRKNGIEVDENFHTGIGRIYAIGDVVAGGIQLAHVASAAGICAVEHMQGKKPSINMKLVPQCIYTSPEIAAIGIGQDEAKTLGIECTTGKFLMGANGKSMIEGADRGFIKTVFNKETGRIIGAQLFCERATDILGELALAISSGMTAEELLNVMRAHPTIEEAVGESVEDSQGCAIHMAPR